jgi:nitroreductase
MSTQSLDSDNLRHALELAGRAPSVHNTQPWQFVVSDTNVDLYANLQRWLPATDADRRDLMVSCGAALHHLRLALESSGLAGRTSRLPRGEESDLLALVEFVPSPASASELAAQIPRRRSDRRPFRHWPIPAEFLAQLVQHAADQGTVLRLIDDPRARAALLDAFAQAETAQDEVVGYNAELTVWTGLRASSEGVPARNLPDHPLSGVSAQRAFDPGDLSSADVAGPEEDNLLVLGTASDDRLSQLRAGEALSAVLLHATRLGLASCPLSQPLEVADTRQVLRDEVLGGTLSPQIVIRLGWPQDEALPPTPRRPVEETLGRLPR